MAVNLRGVMAALLTPFDGQQKLDKESLRRLVRFNLRQGVDGLYVGGFWTPQPDLATGAEAWILAGGAHHTAFSYDLTAEQMGDWAAAMGIEAVYIDKDTTIRNFKNELRWNEVAFRK